MTAPSARLPRRFFAIGFCVEATGANLGTALPLWLRHEPGGTALAGTMLATAICAIAVGAVLGGAAGRRWPSNGHLLAGALGLLAASHMLVLLHPGLVTLGAAAALDGLAYGLYWVGGQRAMSQRSGAVGSERNFLRNYLWYVCGGISGPAATGVTIATLPRLGVTEQAAAGLAFGIGVVVALTGLALWWPLRDTVTEVAPATRGNRRPLRGVRFQAPDLMIIMGLALLIPLLPVVLADHFGLSPLTVGIVLSAIAAGKLTGVMTTTAAVRWIGARRSAIGFLASGTTVALCLAPVSGPAPYIAATFLVAFFGAGVWPVVVDAGLARLPVGDRAALTTSWTVRQYAVMAAATASSGWMVALMPDPRTLVLLAAGAMGVAAAGTFELHRTPALAPGD